MRGSRPRTYLALVALVLALVSSAELLGWTTLEAYHDWDQHLAYQAISVASVRDHHELPFWNPYPCGGLPDLAHPESRAFSPLFLAWIALPPLWALKLDVLAHAFFLALGAALYLRARLLRAGADPSAQSTQYAALLGAAVFTLTSAHALHLAEGHLWILAWAWAPWVLLALDPPQISGPRAILAGALIALMIGEAGIYPVPALLLLLGLLGIARALVVRRLAPLRPLGIALGSAALLAGPKLFPMLALLARRPRLIAAPEQLSLPALGAALVDRDQAVGRAFAWTYWPWHEQGHYVGLLALVLALLGLVHMRRRAVAPALSALVFVALAAGTFAPWAPFALLHRWPLFSSLHVPSRLLMISVLALAELAALGAWSLGARLGPRRGALATALLLAAVVADLGSAKAGILAGPRVPPPVWPAQAPVGLPFVSLTQAPPSTIAPDAPSSMTQAVRFGVGILEAYEPLCLARLPELKGIDSSAYRGELVEATASARIVGRTQGSLRLWLNGPGRAVVQQSFDPGWSADRGRVFDAAGRLGLEVESGGPVLLRYRPPGFDLGLFTCALTLFFWALLSLRTLGADADPSAP
ncbi:MAG: hypothetical protein U1E65_22325 [Myxococcota bacterium]